MGKNIPTRVERQTETRRRILASAERLFTEKGYHGASVGGIAAAAGYTTGAIYSNFGGKEDLFLAILESRISRHVDYTNELAGQSDPRTRREGILERVRWVVRQLADPPDRSEELRFDQDAAWGERTLVTLEYLIHIIRNRPDLRERVAERVRAVDERKEDLYRGLRSDPVRPVNSATLRLAESFFMEGMALRLRLDPELLTPDEAADLFEAVILEADGSRLTNPKNEEIE